MGRLITPISEEEFEKLPKWQQWYQNHWLFVLFVISNLVSFSIWGFCRK